MTLPSKGGPGGPPHPWAVVVGRFCPMHRGHAALLEFASAISGDNHWGVVVRVGERDAIPASKRVEWVKGSRPARVMQVQDGAPDAASRIAAEFKLPPGKGLLMSLEPEHELAAALGATMLSLDLGLGVEPSAIEKDPLAHWDLLFVAAREFLRRVVAVVGFDRAARGALVGRLARHFGATTLPDPLVLAGVDFEAGPTAEQVGFAGSMVPTKQPLVHDPPLVFSEGDPQMVKLWSELAHGGHPTWMDDGADSPQASLLLLLDGPTEEASLRLERVNLLGGWSHRSERLRGSPDEQFQQAVAAVERLLSQRFAPPPKEHRP